ncbi:6-phosphofructo-2-kinase/fructose-2,6-bisphosphatase-like [Schistocerca serialis cubense]|uniref:6-phosphofructo-2-kinase/fructose-2, 6-bisphosphatase-like n=1 Tax=Schistocerca serialis cubense TaxID=2023355 RepID=UPI00214E46FB|nr:6-phosphofructo-2-kinase/fructose-2,6-bisphosphatase-like [Schistocerca serialis cubense]
MAPTRMSPPQTMPSKDELAVLEASQKEANNGTRGTSTRSAKGLVVVMVGMPARSKSATAHKLDRYLRWTGEMSKVFTVSNYRRKLVERYDNHNLFRADNKEAMEIRAKSAQLAMDDATDWLKGGGNIVILDGTHIAHYQRQKVHDHFEKRMSYRCLFIECICDDNGILSRNVNETLQNSPDYKDMNSEKAMDDFNHKIQHYVEQYEPLSSKHEPQYRFIKYINDGESIATHKVTGHLEAKVLMFLSNFRPAPKTFYFSRHGESENNVLGRIGGDADLSPRGRIYAKSLAQHINALHIPNLRVWTSELKRTKQTVEGIGAPVEHFSELNELDAGVCEGLSYEEMQEKFPQEFAWRDQDKLRYRYPWGESYIDIMNRLETILLELEHSENILVVSHQAVLRCVLGYFLNKQPEDLPYINVPLHTVIKLTSDGYHYKMECTRLPVECVDTYRQQPKNCSPDRTTQDALITVPSHYDALDLWKLKQSLIEQH